MFMRAIIELGFFEVMSVNCVADSTLAIGFQGEKCAHVSQIGYISERVEVPKEVGHAILRLYLEGDIDSTMHLYELIKTEHLPQNSNLRPIP